MDDYKILFHKTIENEYQTDFSFLTEKLYEESPVYCEHKLAFEKVVSTEDMKILDLIWILMVKVITTFKKS